MLRNFEPRVGSGFELAADIFRVIERVRRDIPIAAVINIAARFAIRRYLRICAKSEQRSAVNAAALRGIRSKAAVNCAVYRNIEVLLRIVILAVSSNVNFRNESSLQFEKT